MKKTDGSKNLSLKTETIRALGADEMKNVNGGGDTWCWTIVVPSSNIILTSYHFIKTLC
jgi:hypothetical protein